MRAARPDHDSDRPMIARRALITGISGQDGTYLAELLHGLGIEVTGVCLRAHPSRVAAVADVRRLDITDDAAVDALVRELRPDDCYHLAAYHRSSQTTEGQSASAVDDDTQYLRTNLLASHGLLRSIRRHQPHCRVFLAGSCHMFGEPEEMPQTERTPLAPNSFYGITKVAIAQIGRAYRRDGLFCCTGILYNHESPLRGPSFVTTRIARGAVEVLRNQRQEVVIGDLDARVDWGFAGDYVDAMRRMLQASQPADYIIATGLLHRVRDFARLAFDRVGLDWTRHVRESSEVHKPVGRFVYCGDPSRIASDLDWRPTTSFPQLVAMMVDHHLTQIPK